MKIQVLNANTDEALHHFVSAGFTPVKVNDVEVALLPRKANREELHKAVSTSETFVDKYKLSTVKVFSGGKGRPFMVFSTN